MKRILKNKKNLRQYLANPLLPIWICAFLDIIGLSILNPYLARIILDMGAPIAQVGILLSVNTFFGFFSGIIWGSLSDKYGRRPILLICRVGTLVGYLLLAFSTNITMLVISRIVDGIFSRNVQVTLTIVGDIVPPSQRSKQMSNAGAAWILGGLIGPGIGALLSLRGVFGLGLFNAGMALLAFLITLFTLKESNPQIVDSAAILEDSLNLNKFTHSLSLLKERAPRLLLSQSFFNTLSHFLFATSISLFITKRFGFSIVQIGGLLTVAGVINMLVRIFVFPITLRTFGDRKTIMIGFIVYLVAFTWLIFLDQVWEFAAVLILVSFGTTCSVDVMTGVMSKAVKQTQMGAMIGLGSAVESITLMLGPAIGAYLLSFSVNEIYGMAPALTSLVSIMLWVIPMRGRKKHHSKLRSNSGEGHVRN